MSPSYDFNNRLESVMKCYENMKYESHLEFKVKVIFIVARRRIRKGGREGKRERERERERLNFI